MHPERCSFRASPDTREINGLAALQTV